METIEIHLTTDEVTGNVIIDLAPDEDSVIPVVPEEWAGLRSELRSTVRQHIDHNEWQPYLDSDRPGERLDVELGKIRLDEDGGLQSMQIYTEDPSDVDWDSV